MIKRDPIYKDGLYMKKINQTYNIHVIEYTRPLHHIHLFIAINIIYIHTYIHIMTDTKQVIADEVVSPPNIWK